MLARLLLFVVVAVFGGLATSWYMIERGTRLTTYTSGPWVGWTAAGRPDADPYTRAHFLRRGSLPLTTALALTFQANTDSTGQALYSSCEYQIEGDDPLAAFWSLAAFDDKGAVIPNPAERYAFNSATVMRGPAGRLDIVLARSARPGNWLPTGGAGRISLVLTLHEPRAPTGAGSGSTNARLSLPTIRRQTCS